MQSELNVVNTLLRVIGESPLNEIDRENPDVLAALNVWDEESQKIQANSYWYNTETWELPVHTDGSVYLPSNTLAVDAGDSNYIKRGRKLYDLENHTYDFSENDTITVDLITEWAIEELPPLVFNYILASAKATMKADYDMDSEVLSKLMREATVAMHHLQAHNLKIQAPNAVNSGTARTLLQNQPTR